MATSAFWRDLAKQFLDAKRYSVLGARRAFEHLGRRGASWFDPQPQGDLLVAWKDAIRERGKDKVLPRTAMALCDLSADFCTVLERIALEKEMGGKRLPVVQPDLSQPVPADTQMSARLKALIKETGLKNEGVAAGVGIEVRSLYRHLAGGNVRPNHLQAYERFFSSRLKREVHLVRD